MSVTTKFGLTITALVGLGSLAVPACSSGESAGPDSGTGSSSGGSSSGSSSGVASPDGSTSSIYCGTPNTKCCASPGQIPNPECDDGDETTCATTASACTVAEPQCGSTSTCEPLTTNTGTTENFRMRRIILVAPKALANTTVQNLVVNSGVDMNEPQCGNPSSGTGDFNWLLSLDTTTNTLTTGGAPPCDTKDTPSCDPFNTGYCFLHKVVDGINVGPVQAAMTKAADGSYGSMAGAIPILNIPIYFGTPASIILLPISDGAVTGMQISADSNCIGTVNTLASQSDCSDDYTQCSKWHTAGSLTGYITLKTADTVNVSLLNETLCVLLTGEPNPTVVGGLKMCNKDANGNPTEKGDYCSTTNSAGGCEDSSWIAATFAASAVKINDGTGVADCTSGLSDSGAPADAASSD